MSAAREQCTAHKVSIIGEPRRAAAARAACYAYAMPVDPYRKPQAPLPGRPRDRIIRQPGGPPLPTSPSGRELVRDYAAANAARQARIARLSLWMRAAGFLAALVGVGLSFLTMQDVAAGVISHPVRVLVSSSVMIAVGVFAACVGMGGGDPEEDARPAKWVLIGLGVATFAGALWGSAFHLDFLAYLAG